MTAFPRTFWPATATWPKGPMVMADVGLSGKTQLRDTGIIGRTWTETYAAILVNPPTGAAASVTAAAASAQGWLAQLEQYLARGTILTIAHPQRRILFGAGGGTPRVNGAGQSGASLITDGWPNSTLVLKAGDIINVAGLNPVEGLVADATTNGSGQVTLSIEPPILPGSSPADNALLTTNATPGSVLFRVRLADIQQPNINVAQYLTGLTLVFVEMP